MNRTLFTSILPTGKLYNHKTFSTRDQFDITVSMDSCNYQLIQPPAKSLLRPSDGWIMSNEPEKHLGIISDKLSSSCPRNILLFSYKDVSLSQKIVKNLDNCVVDSIFSTDEPEFPEDFEEESILRKINCHDTTYDLVICRHYLEHFTRHKEIVDALRSRLSDSGSLYLEVPSSEFYFQRGCPLFLWEQHVVYFTHKSFYQYLISSNLDVLYYISFGDDIEPSLCSVSCKGAIEGKKGDAKKSTDFMKMPTFDQYINLAREILHSSHYKRILAVGAGHNLDRFLQFCRSKDRVLEIYDGNADKIGKYLHGFDSPILPLEQLRSRPDDLIILGIHDRSIPNFVALQRREKKSLSTYLSIHSLNLFT